MYDLSVIMATYKDNPIFLKTCIVSVLDQTYKNFKFIIVVEPDETNMDFLNNVANKDIRVKIIKNDVRLGVAISRNRAIKESLGKYIAIIDGDDYCDLSRFEKQMRFFENHPEMSLVGSNMYLVYENNIVVGERKYPELHEDIKRHFLLTMSVANPTVMMKREDLDEIGLFDSQFSKAEDFELWLRFFANNKKMHNLQENLVYYRVQTNQSEKRGNIHWKNNYIARKRHSKFIWPLHKRFFSLFFFHLVGHIPDVFLDFLLNLKIINKIRNIKLRTSH